MDGCSQPLQKERQRPTAPVDRSKLGPGMEATKSDLILPYPWAAPGPPKRGTLPSGTKPAPLPFLNAKIAPSLMQTLGSPPLREGQTITRGRRYQRLAQPEEAFVQPFSLQLMVS